VTVRSLGGEPVLSPTLLPVTFTDLDVFHVTVEAA
jgi:hypothetical protein